MKNILRKYLVVLPAAALLFGVTACDSDDTETSDSDVLAGGWAVTGVSDDNGPADLTVNFNSIVVNFNNAGGGTIVVDAKDDAGDATLNLTYALNETAKSITINISVPNVGTIPLQLTYAIQSGNNAVNFTANSANAVLINSLFGTELTGNVTLSVTRL